MNGWMDLSIFYIRNLWYFSTVKGSYFDFYSSNILRKNVYQSDFYSNIHLLSLKYSFAVLWTTLTVYNWELQFRISSEKSKNSVRCWYFSTLGDSVWHRAGRVAGIPENRTGSLEVMAQCKWSRHGRRANRIPAAVHQLPVWWCMNRQDIQSHRNCLGDTHIKLH